MNQNELLNKLLPDELKNMEGLSLARLKKAG